MAMTGADEPSVQTRVLAAARAAAADRGWPWREPVEVQLQRAGGADRLWLVRTNIFAVGQSVRLVIRERDLAVIDAGFLAR